MSSTTLLIESHPLGATFLLRASPGAKRNAITGVHQQQLKVSVTQAPEKGKANKALLAVVAEQLGLRKSQLEILSGETSSEKRVLVHAITPDALSSLISQVLHSAE